MNVGDKVRCLRAPSCGEAGTVIIVWRDYFYVEYGSGKHIHFLQNEGHTWELIQDDIHTNEPGGKQTDVPYAFHTLPPNALLAVASVFKRGAELYGADNWKQIPVPDHINHMVGHSYKYLSSDTTEEHLANAACRALMALELYLEEKK